MSFLASIRFQSEILVLSLTRHYQEHAGASRTSCRQAFTSSRLQWGSDQRAATRRRSANQSISSHCIQRWKYVRAEGRDRLLRIRAQRRPKRNVAGPGGDQTCARFDHVFDIARNAKTQHRRCH